MTPAYGETMEQYNNAIHQLKFNASNSRYLIIIIIIIAGIAVNETHLTATGIHMSMGSHGITRHPTEATSPP